MGNKLMRISDFLRKTESGYSHWCPACDERHNFYVDRPTNKGARWTFDGNVEMPTFTPSMNIRRGPRPIVPKGRTDAGQVDVCHYFLRNGEIQFLGDCTHALAGKTVPLPKFPEDAK